MEETHSILLLILLFFLRFLSFRFEWRNLLFWQIFRSFDLYESAKLTGMRRSSSGPWRRGRWRRGARHRRRRPCAHHRSWTWPCAPRSGRRAHWNIDKTLGGHTTEHWQAMLSIDFENVPKRSFSNTSEKHNDFGTPRIYKNDHPFILFECPTCDVRETCRWSDLIRHSPGLDT